MLLSDPADIIYLIKSILSRFSEFTAPAEMIESLHDYILLLFSQLYI